MSPLTPEKPALSRSFVRPGKRGDYSKMYEDLCVERGRAEAVSQYPGNRCGEEERQNHCSGHSSQYEERAALPLPW